jgi:hypothetical protein
MKTVFGAPLAEYLFAASVWLVAAIFLLLSYSFSAVSREVPALICWATLVLTSLDLVSRLQLPAGQALNRLLNPGLRGKDATEAKPTSSSRLAIAIAAIIVLATGLVLFGVLYVVPVFLFVALYWGGKCRLVASALLAAVVTAFIWGLFTGLLRLELYPGLLLGGDW